MNILALLSHLPLLIYILAQPTLLQNKQVDTLTGNSGHGCSESRHQTDPDQVWNQVLGRLEQANNYTAAGPIEVRQFNDGDGKIRTVTSRRITATDDQGNATVLELDCVAVCINCSVSGCEPTGKLSCSACTCVGSGCSACVCGPQLGVIHIDPTRTAIDRDSR